MKLLITRNTVAGGITVFKGDVIDALPKESSDLLNLKKAVPYVAPDPELAVKEPKVERAVKKRGRARAEK